MQTHMRFKSLCISLVAASLLFTTTLANAQFTRSSYMRGYDSGYDDGYDDAMDDCPCPPLLFALTGFYAGFNFGYNSFSSNNKLYSDEILLTNNDSRSTGWLGNIFGGYGQVFPNRFYLGGEVYLGTTNAQGTNTLNLSDTTTKVQFSANTNYGFTVLPGYKLPTGPLVYLRLGANQTQFETKTWTNLYSASNFNQSTWKTGYSLGVGIETDIYKQLGLRFDYDYINYNSINNSMGTLSTKIEPTDHRTTLGLVYNFSR